MSDTFNTFIRYFFLISALLIIVVYFVGFGNDVSVFGHVFQVLSYAFTGRDSSGKFANYPTGGGTAAAGA